MDNVQATCPLHNTTMYEKTGQYGSYFSHIIQNVGFCDGKKIKPFKQPAQIEGVKPASELQPVTVSKKHDTMLMCNAMNNAVAMVNAGIVHEDALQNKFESILQILESKT